MPEEKAQVGDSEEDAEHIEGLVKLLANRRDGEDSVRPKA
jgi:hypothetical protein